MTADADGGRCFGAARRSGSVGMATGLKRNRAMRQFAMHAISRPLKRVYGSW